MKIGIFGVLFVVLLTLKLASIGVMATASWAWVIAPLLVPLVFWIAIFGLSIIAER